MTSPHFSIVLVHYFFLLRGKGGLGGRTWEKKDGESLPLQGVFYLERNMVVVMMMTMKIVLLMMM